MKGTINKNLCQTFLCDLSPASVTPSGYKIPYDMCVFIHHIYRKLHSADTISANKSAVLDAIRYVATLYNGTGYDKQVGDRLAMIVQDHVSEIKSDTVTNIRATPQDWSRASDFTIQLPLYKLELDLTSVSKATVGMGSSGSLVDLSNLLNNFDGKAPTPDYQRVLAKKVSLYNLSIYEMKQLALTHAATLKPTNKGSPASYFDPKPRSPSSTDGYYRKEADPSKLYKVVKDLASGTSTEEEVHPGSKYHSKIMSRRDTCNDIHGTTGADNASCTRFIMDCLMGDKKGMNDDKCKAVLKDSNFWTQTKKEIFEDMLPDVACSVLDSFGFEKVKVSNGKHTNLNAYEDKGAWLARLDKNYSSDYDAISKNANLMAYLDMLLNKVNGSPAILNTNYYSKTSTGNINLFTNSRLKQAGVQALNASVYPNGVSLNNITNILGANMNANRLAFGLSNILQPIIVMRGGDSTITIQQRASQSLPSTDWANQVQKNSPLLRKVLEHYTTALAGIDRQIDEKDLIKLNDALTSLENSEDLLVQNVLVMHEYLNIMLNWGKYDETTKNESLINIRKFVESSGKRLDKIEKGTNNLVITLQKLSDALSISVNGKPVV